MRPPATDSTTQRELLRDLDAIYNGGARVGTDGLVAASPLAREPSATAKCRALRSQQSEGLCRVRGPSEGHSSWPLQES